MQNYVDQTAKMAAGAQFTQTEFVERWRERELQGSWNFIAWIVGALFILNYAGDVYWPPWSILTTGALFFLTFMALRREIFNQIMGSSYISPFAIMLFGYVAINANLMLSWRPLTAYSGAPIEEVVVRRADAGHLLTEWLILSGLFYQYWPKIRKPIAMGLFFGGAIHAGFLIFDQVMPMLVAIPEEDKFLFMTKGLLGNRSIGASFTAVWIFFSLYISSEASGVLHGARMRRFARSTAFALGLPAILISVSSISFGAFGVALVFAVVAAMWNGKASWGEWGIACIMFSFFAGTSWSLGQFIDPEWGHHISRQDAWPMFLKAFLENDHATWFFGYGAGSFKHFGPVVQEINNYMPTVLWTWAHSDWLQIFIELGMVGLILSACTYISLLAKSWKRPLLFASVICFGIVMIGNYPLHIAIFSLLGWWIAFETWKESE